MSDFIIIGGGIAGLSAAATLSKLGSVTLLETETALGYHASGRSAAVFLKNYGNDVVRALNSASVDHHNSAGGGVLTKRSMMMLGRPEERDDFQSQHRSFGMTEISPEQARDLVPILNPETCAFAAVSEDVFNLDADRLLQDFTKQARKNGAVIKTRSPVLKITKTKTGWEIETPDQTYSARIIINAAGAWVDEIARLAGIKPLGFQPMRRSIAVLPAPAGHDVGNWPLMDGVNERWYAKPDAGTLLVSPSEEHPTDPHDAWADDMVLAQGLDRYAEMVTEPVTRVISSWAGLRTFAPDRSLVLGADPADASFYWCAGQGGYGFQTAPAASRLIADLLNGSGSEFDNKTIAALSPDRFG